MKKLMALCLSLLMVLSMVSFSVMAENAVVDFSAIANGQPANFVTGNLSLGENVITSSNEAVIATDGKVTRPIYNDATVKLTINGGEAFDVVVKAKTTNVLYANDFSAAVGEEWSLKAPVGNTVSSVENGALHVIIGDTTGGRTWNTYRPAEISGTTPVTFRFDMSNITDIVSAGMDIRITGKRYDAAGNEIGGFSTITIARCNSTSGFGTYWFGRTRTNVTLKYNPTTGEFWGNDVLSASNLMTCTDANFTYNEGKTAEDCAKVVITEISITNAAGGCTGTFDMDNFVQYEEVSDEDALASATPAEKLASYSTLLDKDYVANGGSLDAITGNLKFTAENLPADVELSWTSTNPAIASDGTVKRHVIETQTATITGTLSVDGERISKSYDVKILPLTIAGRSELVDFDSYNLVDGAAVNKAGWTVSDSNASITNVIDNGNSYARVSSTLSGGASKVISYSFDKAPALGDARYYIMSFDYKVATPIANVINVGLKINGTEIAEFINRATTKLHGQDWTPGQIWYGGSYTGGITPPSEFVNLKISVDTATKIVSYIIDGRTISTVTCPSVDFTNIGSAELYVDWRAASGAFDIDNIKIYAENTLEGVIPTLSDADKVGFYKYRIVNSVIGEATVKGAVLDLDNGYADYAPATYGVAVEWASDNTAYIANDGTVTKLAPHGTTATVNMTATITAGGASDTVTIPVAVGSETTLIASVDYDDTSVDIGSKATYGTDPEYGSIVTMTNPTEGTHKASGTLTSITGAGRYDRVVFEADMKYNDDGANYAAGGIGLKTIAGRAGINVYLNYTTNKVHLITTAASVNSGASYLEATASKTIYYQMPASIVAKGEGAWVHLMVDHNVLSQTYNIYLDGILVNDVPILQADMDLGSNGGSAIRGYSLELSGKGTICVDNLELYKYKDANAVEVNAALNAALIQFASDIQSPVLVNQQLPAMTIGRSWVTGSQFNRDLNGSALKPTNVSTYTYVEDGPQVTYAIDGKTVTAIDVASPKVVQLTITASANGITESKTVTRKVAPVAIRSLALGTASCLNGAWIDGADGTEKLIVAKYLENKFVSAFVVDFAETEPWDSIKGEGDRFDEVNSIVNNLGTSHPNEAAEYDQLKIFVVSADGITPLTYANTELHS